jgi:hypothetical protein
MNLPGDWPTALGGGANERPSSDLPEQRPFMQGFSAFVGAACESDRLRQTRIANRGGAVVWSSKDSREKFTSQRSDDPTPSTLHG